MKHLRRMTADDIRTVLNWRNDPSVREFMYTRHEIAESEHREWFARASQDPKKGLFIYEQDKTPAGFVQITKLSEESPVCDWGFYVAPQSSPGTGIALGRTALRFVFESLEIHKVCGQALAFNERSIRFHKKLGFIEEGRLREQHYDGTEFHDVLCFGLLASEWQFHAGDSAT